jgi:hypothetical protein
MSINYTQLFSRLGTIIGQINTWLAEQTTLLGTGGGSITTGVMNILAQYETRPDLTVGLESLFQGDANTVAGWESALKRYADGTITDLQQALNAPNSSVNSVLPLMVTDMVNNTQSVQKNTPSITSTTNFSGNTGTGILNSSVVAVPGQATTNDERILNQTVKFTCISDAFSGAVAGQEQFNIIGWPTQNIYSNFTQGQGSGPNITVGGRNTINNGSFSSYTGAGVFPSWTTVTGAALISQTTSSSLIQNGVGALLFTGNGSTATATLTQAGSNSLSASTTYVFSVWLRQGTGTLASGSTFQVSLSGTGLSTTYLFNADPSTLTTTYALYTVFINLPNTFSNPLVTITWTGASGVASTGTILVDNINIGAPTTYGNVQYALFAGGTNYLRGDNITVITANNNAGVIQTFFGRFYSTNLPSGSSPTIPDSLVT